MKIIARYLDAEKTWETQEPDVVFGRSDEESEALLNLFPDKKVSREHGRIWEEAGVHWIEDLNSKGGLGSMVRRSRARGNASSASAM